MRLFPVGDAAVAILPEAVGTDQLGRVRAIAAAVEAAAIPGVVDVVAAPERVAVGYDPRAIGNLAAFEAAVAAAAAGDAGTRGGEATLHEFPVVYDGPDCDDLCGHHGLDRDALVRLHTEPEYAVEAVGFLPGFGYLGGLPEQLVTPRRATPRPQVPAGSVGIGGSQTGVYPFASPGGWHLIGRSPARLFDLSRERPALLAVGDRVRFREVSAAELAAFTAAEGDATGRGVGNEQGDPLITVLQPGLFTTIQDLGRPGYRGSGVPLSGAADQVSLAIANMLVGNAPAAAAIECTLLGPTLRFEQAATVALAGAAFPGLPAGQAMRVPAGAEIALGHVTAGCRGYLAVGGGIEVPAVLGSRSTFVSAALGGFAGRPLRAGDRLSVGDEASRARDAAILPPGLDAVQRLRILRVVPGEHAEWFSDVAWGQTFRTSSRSNRMGARLEGEPLAAAPAGAVEARVAGSLRSIPVFPGTVQVPPDGLPIILLADAQTIGGYPVLGQVIAADLPIVAQLRPGDEIAWEPVSLAEAHAALREQQAAVAAFGGDQVSTS